MGPKLAHNTQPNVSDASAGARGRPPGQGDTRDAPLDQTMDAWGMAWADEITTALEAINPDTRTDDHIEQLQT